MGEQVVGGQEQLAVGVEEDRVGRAVARAVEDLERAVAQLDRLAVVQHARHVGPGAPGAERPRDRLERAHHVLGDPVAQHQSRANSSSASASSRKRSTNGTAASIAATSAPECDATSDTRPRWSMCWWVRMIELDVLERVAEAGDPALELVERGAGVGARVHERQRLVLDQVDVHAPDRERGRDGEAVDARLGGGGEGVVAHARISASTSSRFSSMCSRETQRLEVQAQQRLGVRGPHVEVPVLVVHRHAVELGDLAVGVALAAISSIFAGLVRRPRS